MSSLLNQVYLAMFIGFGLAMGVMLFIGLIKIFTDMADAIIRWHLKIKPFSFNAVQNSKVFLFGKKWIVQLVTDEGASKTWLLRGFDHQGHIIISNIISKDKGA